MRSCGLAVVRAMHGASKTNLSEHRNRTQDFGLPIAGGGRVQAPTVLGARLIEACFGLQEPHRTVKPSPSRTGSLEVPRSPPLPPQPDPFQGGLQAWTDPEKIYKGCGQNRLMLPPSSFRCEMRARTHTHTHPERTSRLVNVVIFTRFQRPLLVRN